MSQNDFNIANQGFPSFRSDLNSSLQALASNSSGATEPDTTYAYQWWYDSTADVLKMRNADNDAWITFASFDQAADSWSFASLTVDGAFTSLGIDDNASATAMTLDSSGVFSVANTTTAYGLRVTSSLTGMSYTPTDYLTVAADNGPCFYGNRTGSDGDIMVFNKDGTTVGSIGTEGGFTYYTGGSGSGVKMKNAAVVPTSGTGVDADGTESLGQAAYRWDDVYATNGTIQTSDRNEKQDIEALSDAEQRVAVACKGLLRKFRWKDAVAEKGDDARIHFGIIAQDLQDAFAAEGLDAGRYAMFISSTWWEKQTEVPAVEAVAAVDATYDEDGNELTPAVEAVEAKDAYTRTDTYETLEEAPEGATERTRLGVRYPELLAFIIAAI